MNMRIDELSQSQAMPKIQGISNESNTKRKVTKDSRPVNVGAGVVAQGMEKKVNEEEIIHAIEAANKSVEVYDRKLEFSIHEKTKEIMVKVIDTSKGEIVREIPSKKTLDMVANLLQAAGILIDEKA